MMRRLLLLVVLLAAAAYFAGSGLLALMGEYLIDEDTPAPADVIVVLAGSLPDRILEGVTLYQDGYAPRMILSRGRENAAYAKLDAMGVRLPRLYDLNRSVAEQLGVPPSAITEVGGGMDGSTLLEAQAILSYVRAQGYKRILLVTSKVHTRRAAAIYRHLAAGGVEVIVRPSRYDRFQPQGWWHDRTDIRRVLIEYQKLLVFLLLDRWRVQPVTAAPPATAAAHP